MASDKSANTWRVQGEFGGCPRRAQGQGKEQSPGRQGGSPVGSPPWDKEAKNRQWFRRSADLPDSAPTFASHHLGTSGKENRKARERHLPAAPGPQPCIARIAKALQRTPPPLLQGQPGPWRLVSLGSPYFLL